ncbi:hypothetical protein PIB30_008103 [Stylosanthes scabra]|uniref:Uncharacterized protein n=1 Tax=Stylosanthes scabra TaxID=79078 RepID=A0ABU6X6I1_9FABA|nr:hypothetical protein [Stylosanthes scabra]
MVGQWNKPSRSDEVVDPDEQLRIADEIRAQFEALAPKRPIKPNRSEPDQHPPGPVDPTTTTIPELQKFHSLQSHSHVCLSLSLTSLSLCFSDDDETFHSQDMICKDACADAQDEFVETDYYNKLASIDKQHHTTGSGFIKVLTEEGGSHHHLPNSQNHLTAAHETNLRGGYKCNPATNDWLPNIHDDQQHHQVFTSSKPNRSESS